MDSRLFVSCSREILKCNVFTHFILLALWIRIILSVHLRLNLQTTSLLLASSHSVISK